MTDQDYDELFAEIKLPDDVKKRLDKVHTDPEGEVEALWVHRLITTYLFKADQIALQRPAGAGRNAATSSVFADIVAYRDKKRKEPFVVVEVKKKNSLKEKDSAQAESYSRNLGAEYHVVSDWITTHFFKTSRYLDSSTKVGTMTEGGCLLKQNDVWFLYWDEPEAKPTCAYGLASSADLKTWTDRSAELRMPKDRRHGNISRVPRSAVGWLKK